MLVNYNPESLPDANEFSRYTIQYEEPYNKDISLDWIEKSGQILCVIPCSDGLVVFMRTTKGGAMPPYNIQCIRD